MRKITQFIRKLSNQQKITSLILILSLILLVAVGLPSLARYKNRVTIINAPVWDGSTATNYRKGEGSSTNPYIISTGAELAYFSSQLATNDYANTYFALSNDIVLNQGLFSYETADGIKYILNGQTYYIDDYTNKYYDNVNREGTEIGTVNVFNSLNNFKGNFDGKSYRIFGLYMTDQNSNELALFNNLQGNIKDLYVENAFVYGGVITSGIASTTNNASLTNVLFNGNVIGKSEIVAQDVNITPTSSLINLQTIETTDYITLLNNTPLTGGEIVSTSITGNYTLDGATEEQTTIKINGVTVTNGSFNIDLGTTVLSQLPVVSSTTSQTAAALTFTNLNYKITYKYAVTSGIIGNSNNTTIKNTINKASIKGPYVSGGIVGFTTSALNIEQSYNTGNITGGTVSGGIIGVIEKSSDNIDLTKSYNTGNMSATDFGGIVGIISNNIGTITIDKVFNTSTTEYSLGTVNNTTVNVSDSYFANSTIAIDNGTTNGTLVSTSMSNLQTETYVLNNLEFNKFVTFEDVNTNTNNVWLYAKDSLPILFIDDDLSPIASLHASVYSWDNLSPKLNPIKLDSNITFSIEANDELVPIKEAYYYVSNSITPLTTSELSEITSWQVYSDIEQISNEGVYVIYAKIVDYDDNVSYINSDLLVLNWSGTTVDVSVKNSTWSNLRTTLNSIYINKPEEVVIEAIDNISGIASVKYFVSTEILTLNALEALNDSTWLSYSEPIQINEQGITIVYAKVVDNFDYVTYVNTDYIVFDGYEENSVTIGRNNSYLTPDRYITNKSAMTFNITYTGSYVDYQAGYKHNLISNLLLPQGSKITLIDNITDKVYEYQITTSDDIYNYNESCSAEDASCVKVATYPLTLFSELGSSTGDKYYVENTYNDNGTVNEDFTIILDLSNTNITANHIDIALYMHLNNASNVMVRPTLQNTIKPFNIYSSIDGNDTRGTLYLTTNYSGDPIQYNSESSTDISLETGINYKQINSSLIIDSSYENQEIGLALKLVDSNGVIVDREHLKNITFKIGETIYYPEQDNIVHINLKNGIMETEKILTIITQDTNDNLEDGTYYFKISNYVSADGYYYQELGSTELSIPVNVSTNSVNVPYSFDVIMDDTNRIISKLNNEVNVLFNILQTGELSNPNIKIALYKKEQLTAYNQNYIPVSLNDYISNELTLYSGNIYNAINNPIKYTGLESSYNQLELNLLTSSLENNGYKFIFYLYDGTKKIGTIEKYFIVK